MQDADLARFLAAFPPAAVEPVDAEALAAEVEAAFGVPVPAALAALWRAAGCGSFADGELYLFGRDPGAARDPLVAWNRQGFWPRVQAPPALGGAVFFAETCFGDQLGFRYPPGGGCEAALLTLAPVGLYVLAREFGRLVPDVLSDRYAVADPGHLAAARQAVPRPPAGHWYCPIVSPLVGGAAEPSNFMVMQARAFALAAITEWEALGSPQ